jgi:RNA polymerase sigma factor (sigma-70 family)
MPTTAATTLRRAVRATLATEAEATDGQLLGSFVADRAGAAFEQLVRRHGPMVLGVCRRVLGHRQDAEDAFQATFLVLARRASSIRDPERLGNWLYGVAHRTALAARRRTARLRAGELQVDNMPHTPAPPEELCQDLRPVIDEELARLPEKHRLPIILCDLEGRTRTDVARQLGIPEGTLSNRLAAARRALATRLTRRGFALSAGAVVAALSQDRLAAAVQTPLLASTVAAATASVGGAACGAGCLRPEVVSLTNGVLNAMTLTKLKLTVGVLLLAGALVAGGTFVLAHPTARAGQGGPPPRAGGGAGGKVPDAPKASPQVLAHLQKAADAARDIEDSHLRASTLEYVGRTQSQAGDKVASAKTFAAAVEAAEQIRGKNLADPGADTRSALTWIAVAQAEAGDVAAALKTAEKVAPVLGAQERARTEVARARARTGDVDGALKAAKDLPAENQDQVRATVVEAQAAAGKVKEAAETAGTVKDPVWRVFALAAVARAQAKAKDTEAARASLREAVKLTEGIEGVGGRHAAFATLAEVQAEMGDADAARKSADAIKDGQGAEDWRHNALTGKWRDIALTPVVAAQARAGDAAAALKTAEAIEGEYRRGEAVRTVVLAQLRAKNLKAGEKTAEAIKSPCWRITALADIAAAQAAAGDRATARKTFAKAFEEAGEEGQNIPDGEHLVVYGLRNTALCAIVRAQVESGEEEAAVAWATKQSSPLLRCQAFVTIASGLMNRKKL